MSKASTPPNPTDSGEPSAIECNTGSSSPLAANTMPADDILMVVGAVNNSEGNSAKSQNSNDAPLDGRIPRGETSPDRPWGDFTAFYTHSFRHFRKFQMGDPKYRQTSNEPHDSSATAKITQMSVEERDSPPHSDTHSDVYLDV